MAVRMRAIVSAAEQLTKTTWARGIFAQRSDPDLESTFMGALTVRVVHVGLYRSSEVAGGLNRYLDGLVASLAKADVHAGAVTLTRAKVSIQSGLDASISDSGSRLTRFPRMWMRTLSFPPDVILDVHFAASGLIPVVLARLRGQPVCVHFHGPWSLESIHAGSRRRMVWLKHRVEMAVYRRANVCVVLSAAFANLLSMRYGIPCWQVRQIGPGIEEKWFEGPSRIEARAALSISRDAVLAVAVRRLTPRTGVDVLVKAIAAVRASLGANFRLAVIGTGEALPELQALVVNLGIQDVIAFVGNVDDATVRLFYRAADLSVVPSTALEGFGLAALESLACGTPVIASQIDGLEELLSPVDPCLLVPPGDSDALGDRLEKVATGRLRLPEASLCIARAREFEWHEVAGRHKEVYVGLLDGSCSPASRRIRTVFLDHTAELSGGELALLRLIGAAKETDAHVLLGESGPLSDLLHRSGASVEVLSLPRITASFRRSDVRAGRILRSALASVWYIGKLAARIRSLRPSVVHANSLKSGICGGIACRLARVPMVWQIHDRVSPDYMSEVAMAIVRVAARLLPQVVIANSAATAKTLPARRLHIIPPPVSVRSAEKSTRLSGAALTFGLVGRLTKWKGQDLFLRSFARSFRGGNERALVVGAAMFGDSAFQGELEALAADLGISDQVEFTGFCNDICEQLDRMDVLVHASRIPEPFGQVVAEGMAAGLPVIAADAGGPSELIEPGVTGLLFRIGDELSLSSAMETISCWSGEERDEMGRRASGIADYVSPDRIAREVESVYREVAAGVVASGNRRHRKR